jgi:two-component system response regulator HydG
VGSTDPIHVDFRLISATNRDLRADIGAGRFREDLYYRLGVITMRMPPLRERREDIPLLVTEFLGEYGRREGKAITSVSPDALERLVQYPWPGNVRQLQNAIERGVVVAPGDRLTFEMLPEDVREWVPSGLPASRPPEEWTLEEMERVLVEKALERYHGDKSKAARHLKINRRSLYNRLKKYGGDLKGPGVDPSR